MLTTIIDYESGNLHSAEKAFQRMARETDGGTVVVTSDADVVAKADRIVLPGDGAFPACAAALRGRGAVYDAMRERVAAYPRAFGYVSSALWVWGQGDFDEIEVATGNDTMQSIWRLMR